MAEPRSTLLRTSDGVRLVAVHWPGDRALGWVFAHGFTGSRRDPDVVRIAAQLQAAGCGVLVADLRGHGGSEGVSTVGVKETADVTAAVAWMRGAGYQEVVVIGWSMGASVVLRYAGLGGDCDAVVSVSSPGHWYERGTAPMRLVHWICETATGRLLCRLVRRVRLDPAGWPDLPESPIEVAARIAPTPLLIVHGEEDHYFPVRHAQLLAAAAPTAELWIEAGMGHAESATGPELVERIHTWVRAALNVPTPEVCDDGARD
jgi:pimeloyl-ACP methyl ester carboxylesterase